MCCQTAVGKQKSNPCRNPTLRCDEESKKWEAEHDSAWLVVTCSAADKKGEAWGV